MEPVTSETHCRSGPFWASLPLLAIGVYAGTYLTYAKLRLGYDPTFKSQCNFGASFNCDIVQTHPASDIMGIPIALMAVPVYLLMFFLAWTASRQREGSERAGSYLAALAAVAVLDSIYLAWVSVAEIGAYCPYCILMYVVNISTLVLAVWGRGIGWKATFTEALTSLLAMKAPMLQGIIVFAVLAGLTGVIYSQVKTTMVETEKARIAKEMAEMDDSVADTTDGQARDKKAVEPTDGKTASKEKKGEAKPRKSGAKPKAKLTDNGWSYYEIPRSASDNAIGRDDAPVTYVSFKDFECGFCRFVSSQEKPLKKKYGDKVRFVFKHYPMNADCNYRMGSSRMHEGACRSAFASHCAGEQEKFAEYHDLLYKNQKKFSQAQLRSYAETIGLDIAKYEECLASDRPKEHIEADVRLAARMRINGTPRVYINNRLVTGSTATDVLDYYIQMALKNPAPSPAFEVQEVNPKTPRMVRMSKASGPFWIDAFEASLHHKGKAISVPGVAPAQVSWYEAKDACAKAKKRLCSEEEWVSACIGQAAEDENKNGIFTDGPVQGRLYPYGAFYEQEICRDSEDKLSGSAGLTGAMAGCRTVEGVYDLSGNLYEWVGDTEAKAVMIGGDWRSKTAGTCRRRSKTYGPGIKNATTGFRCCADNEQKEVSSAKDVAPVEVANAVGKKVPSDLMLDTRNGGKLSPKTFAGKVTYLTFFASWCGNCRKQMPAIKDWQTEWEKKGFQVVGINVDRTKTSGERYVDKLEPNFMVAYDPEARTMSDFDINAMPTSFLIDRKGKVVKRVVGYKDEEIAATKTAIANLL